MPEHVWEVRTCFGECIIFPAMFVIGKPDRLIFWVWEKIKIAREGYLFHASVYIVPDPAVVLRTITISHTRKPSSIGFTYATGVKKCWGGSAHNASAKKKWLGETFHGLNICRTCHMWGLTLVTNAGPGNLNSWIMQKVCRIKPSKSLTGKAKAWPGKSFFCIQSKRVINCGGYANTAAKENATEKKQGLFIAVCAIKKPETGEHFMFITSVSGNVMNGCVIFIKLFRLSSAGSVYFLTNTSKNNRIRQKVCVYVRLLRH